MNWPAIIRACTGMNEEQYCQLEYETGVDFLALMESDSPALLAFLERSPEFWAFWREQFWQLGREFINRNRIEEVRKMNKDIVRDKFETYCSLVKVSDTGAKGYYYLAIQLQKELQGQTAEE